MRKDIDQGIISIVKEVSTVLNVDEDIAILAGRINFERKNDNGKWGMMDSIILATADTYNICILTKDSDFKDLYNAEPL